MFVILQRLVFMIRYQFFPARPPFVNTVYTLRFWKNIFRPKYIDVVQSVQSYRVYRYLATSAKHFSVTNTAVDSVVNVTLILARRSETILSRRT